MNIAAKVAPAEATDVVAGAALAAVLSGFRLPAKAGLAIAGYPR